MKKILFALTLVGFSLLGFAPAGAQYYDYGNSYNNSYYDSSYMNSSNMMYSNYSYNQTYYPQTSYGGSYGGGYIYGNNYGYGGGIGSYTIGCTTYYYNTRTGTQLYTQNICGNNYNNYNYTYPYTSTRPYYGNTQYCTYGYSNGSWYPCYSNSLLFGNPGYNNSRTCYYSQYGQYTCY